MGKNFKKFSKTVFGGIAVVSTVFNVFGNCVVNAMEVTPPAIF